MKLVQVPETSFAQQAAELIAHHVSERPDLSLTLPTGATPVGLYEVLRREHTAANFSLSRANVFMLDEYADLPTYPRGSFISFLREHLGDVVFNGSTRLHQLLPSLDPDQLRTYDAALDAAGGLDVAVVGVGRNGHVGFNEPGASLESRTNIVTLSRETIHDNFGEVEPQKYPTRAITMGLKDLSNARSILMLVAGTGKRAIANALLDGRAQPDKPATQLLDHPDLTIVMCDSLAS